MKLNLPNPLSSPFMRNFMKPRRAELPPALLTVAVEVAGIQKLDEAIAKARALDELVSKRSPSLEIAGDRISVGNTDIFIDTARVALKVENGRIGIKATLRKK